MSRSFALPRLSALPVLGWCLLTLASLLSAPAQGQSRWALVAGSPTYSPEYTTNGDPRYLTAPQPAVLWGWAVESQQQGSGSRTFQDRVFRTADAGLSWQEAPPFQSFSSSRTPSQGVRLWDLTALDANTAWALQETVGSSVKSLLHTTTGPQGFTPLVTVLPVSFTTLHFFSATTGIALPAVAPTATSWPLYRTTDGGLTWTLVPNTPSILNAKALEFNQVTKESVGNNLWLSTSAKILLRTTDAGLTWTAIPNVGPVAFEDAQQGLSYYYTASGPHIFRTTDGGLTWQDIPFTGQPGLVAMTAVPGAPGTYLSTNFTYPSANNNAITRTAISYDRGSSWQDVETNIRQGGAMEKLVAASPTMIWAGVERADSGTPNQPLLRRFTGSVLAATPADPAVSGWTVYPNPTTGLVYLSGVWPQGTQVQVMDALGRLYAQVPVSLSQRTVDLSGLPAGPYQLLLTSTESRSVQRLRVLKLP